jgi:RNA polymerase sigma-70 factor (ECF subfamily)
METMQAGAPLSSATTDFVECYLVHYRRLVRALRLGGADSGTAEELAQEAFARALPRWRRVSQGVNPPGYVYTTAFRLLQRSLRRSSRWDVGELPEVAGPQDPTDRAATTSVAVEAVLAVMPPKRRTCAVMCLIVGLSVRETGEALNIADGTVRKHLEEARRELRAVLGDELG